MLTDQEKYESLLGWYRAAFAARPDLMMRFVNVERSRQLGEIYGKVHTGREITMVDRKFLNYVVDQTSRGMADKGKATPDEQFAKIKGPETIIAYFDAGDQLSPSRTPVAQSVSKAVLKVVK